MEHPLEAGDVRRNDEVVYRADLLAFPQGQGGGAECIAGDVYLIGREYDDGCSAGLGQ